MSIVDPVDQLAVLEAAREWLSDPEHWTGGVYWEDANCQGTYERANVRRTCAVGALSYVTPGGGVYHYDDRLVDALTAVLPDDVRIVNDEYDDGYELVIAAYDKVIAAEHERQV